MSSSDVVTKVDSMLQRLERTAAADALDTRQSTAARVLDNLEAHRANGAALTADTESYLAAVRGVTEVPRPSNFSVPVAPGSATLTTFLPGNTFEVGSSVYSNSQGQLVGGQDSSAQTYLGMVTRLEGAVVTYMPMPADPQGALQSRERRGTMEEMQQFFAMQVQQAEQQLLPPTRQQANDALQYALRAMQPAGTEAYRPATEPADTGSNLAGVELAVPRRKRKIIRKKQ